MTMQRAFCPMMALLILVASAHASLVGGTYSTTTVISAWPGSPTYTSIATPSVAGGTFQGFPSQTGGAKTVLGETFTPTSTFTLGAISILATGGTATNNAMSLHIYAVGNNPSSSVSSSYTIPNPDMLGGGNGLSFAFPGFSDSAGRIVTFALDNTGTSDNIVLNAGTKYAVELWNASAPYNGSLLNWGRVGASPTDPGGQMFGSHDSSTTRLTIDQEGLAGGAPRTADLALYSVAVPEVNSFVLGGAVCGMLGLTYLAHRNHKRNAVD